MAGAYEIVVRAQDSSSFTDGFVQDISEVTISLAQSAISPPANFKASNDTTHTPARQNAIWLEWDASADNPPAYTDFYEIVTSLSSSTDPLTLPIAITTGALFASFAVEDTVNHYFWIRAVDSARNRSAFTSSVVGKAIAVAQRDFTLNPILNACIS